jgi:hypothetical protein
MIGFMSTMLHRDVLASTAPTDRAIHAAYRARARNGRPIVDSNRMLIERIVLLFDP